MPLNKVVNTDILVIGGGLAGCFAAIKAREKGMKVTLIDKAYVGKAGTSAVAMGHLAIFRPEIHDFNRRMNFITHAGEYLNNREWVEIILNESCARYQDLVSWGIPFVEESEERIRWMHIIYEGVTDNSVADWVRLKTGEYMPWLRKKITESNIDIIDRLMITNLVKDNGRVVGAVGFHTRNGDFYLFKAKSTILAMGSGGLKLGGHVHYATSDGEAMAYRAGAEITGKEFGGKDNQRRKDTLVHQMTRVPHRRIINAEGEEFYKRYFPGGIMEFDWPCLAATSEVHAGRGPIFCDFSNLTTEQRKDMVAYAEEPGHQARKRIDYLTETSKMELLWGSGVGSTGWGYGGIVVNTKCETNLPGLYAAGDNAGTRFAGSSYVARGYGLSGAATTGCIAAESAVQYASIAEEVKVDEKGVVADLREITYAPLSRKGGFSSGWVLEMLRNIMIPYYVTMIKHGERLQAALTMVNFLQSHLVPKVKANDAHELRMAHEAQNMTLAAEMILRSSLFRTESRGGHFREDYPRRGDPEWLAWVILKEEGGEMKLSKLPIPKEWWPDLSKPYKDRYEFRFPGE